MQYPALSALAASLVLSAPVHAVDASANPYHLEQQTHAALAQYYRWYQVYERPFTPQRIANQKDLLSDEVEIHSAQVGILRGKEHLEQRLRQFTGWHNAHHVQSTAVQVLESGELALQADIAYFNVRPDESRHAYTIRYDMVLRPRANDLPVIDRVTIQPTGTLGPFEFQDAYPSNRVRSLVHYWLYLVETGAQRPQAFQELLAPGFSMVVDGQAWVSQWVDMEQWLHSLPQRVRSSSHQLRSLQLRPVSENVWEVDMAFDWRGQDPQGRSLAAQTRHQWLVHNDPDERFARIGSMRVDYTEAPRPVASP